jgi:hypothetical protein
MPLPAQIDQCLNKLLAVRPDLRAADGTVNPFAVLECVWRSDDSDHLIPIDVNVIINRVTGDLRIHRRQDGNNQHDTENYGTCKVLKPLF